MAGEALIAVATNFADPMTALEADFEARTGHSLTVTTGSTGKLYAQIVRGAPFDVLLAADRARPERLEQEGEAVAGSRFSYAVGRLVLWGAQASLAGRDGLATLRAADFRTLAIANPDLAPYGAAAKQVLTKLALWDTLSPRIVMGQNAGQAFALVATRNAELGLVARTSVLSHGAVPGDWWAVPADLHDPIIQDAVLMSRAANNPAAKAFMGYMQSEDARAIMRRFGFEVD